MERLPRKPQVHQLDPDETDQRKARQERIGPRIARTGAIGRTTPRERAGDGAPEGKILHAPPADERREAGDLGLGGDKRKGLVRGKPGRNEAEGSDGDRHAPPRRSIGNWLRLRQSSASIHADQTDGRGPDSDGESEADPGNERAADESGMRAAENERDRHEIVASGGRCDPPPRRQGDDRKNGKWVVTFTSDKSREKKERNGCGHH